MSFQAVSWAIDQQIVRDPAARHILVIMASYTDKYGRHAFPSVESLTEDTGWSRRTIQAKLRLLEEAGLIREGNQKVAAAYIKEADKRPIVYDLVIGPVSERGAAGAPRKLPRKPGAEDERGAGAAPRSDDDGAQLTAERGATDDVAGRTTCAQSSHDHPLSIVVRSRAKNKTSKEKKPDIEQDPTATRIPADWKLTTELLDWALAEQPTWDAAYAIRESTQFRDYWTSQAGRTALSPDWPARWRLWVRRAFAVKASEPTDAGAGEWWETPGATEQKGAELKVSRKKDEPHPHYRVRVAKAAGRGPWIDAVLRDAEKIGAEFYREVAEYFGEALLPADFGI